MGSEETLDRLLVSNRLAVQHFTELALRIEPGAWTTPRADGKWTPAQEVRHIILAYEVFIRELRGGEGMRMVGTRWQRLMWRSLGLPSVIYRRKIPVAAPAPKEIRPPDERGSATTLAAELRSRLSEFEEEFAKAWIHAPRTKMTHAYFGKLSLRQSMAMAEVHTQHHATFLSRSAEAP